MSVDEREAKEAEEFRTGPLSVLTTSVKTNSQVCLTVDKVVCVAVLECFSSRAAAAGAGQKVTMSSSSSSRTAAAPAAAANATRGAADATWWWQGCFLHPHISLH